MKISELLLDPSLQSAIDQLGFTDCTPIQELAIPVAIEGKDISGLAQTGTGKTAAFLIPLMERILRGRTPPEILSEDEKILVQKRAFVDWKAQNFVLILVPTRELAEQVYENIKQLSVNSGLRGVSVYGGTSYDKQKEAFQTGVEFVVATPGRLIDLYKEHVLDLKQVRAIVFDEADRMFDMGFKDDMKYILQRVPKERQFLVFSATLNFDVLNTAYQFGAEPIELNISRDQAKAENVIDEIFHIGDEEKPSYLLSLIKKYKPRQVIVFSNFKTNVEQIANFLSSNGYPAMGISSLLSQVQRNRVIEQFKSENEMNILVATDVAARGLDIKGVDMVFNVELPNDAESYVHRIGRTGRAGSEGRAFSLVSDRDVESLARIEDYLKHKLAIGWLDDSEIQKEFKAPVYGSSDRPQRGTPERRERPPRQEGRPRPAGPGPKAPGRGPRHEKGPRQERSARSERGPRQERGPKTEATPRQETRPRPPRHQNGAARTPHPHPKASGGRQHRPAHHKSTRPPTSAAPGVVQKVAGFLKKLFGASESTKKNS